jgi:hypothetical protein
MHIAAPDKLLEVKRRQDAGEVRVKVDSTKLLE